MQLTFIETSNEKFAYSYALEKSIRSVSKAACLYFYDGIEEITRSLSELRWLLVKELRSVEIDEEKLNEHLTFRVIENVEDTLNIANSGDSECFLEFHIFPSRKLLKLTDYIKFLIRLQENRCDGNSIVLIDSLSCGKINNFEMLYSMMPPKSILTVASHPASGQFELQRLIVRGIVETIKINRETDRIKLE